MQLHRARQDFDAAGARLVVVGQGRPEHAAEFRRAQEVDLPLLVDTERQAYEAAGTKIATFDELLGPKVVAKGVLTALRTRKVQGRVIGDPAQLGGVLVVARDGAVTYAHLSEDAGDNPPTSEVLAAAREAAARG